MTSDASNNLYNHYMKDHKNMSYIAKIIIINTNIAYIIIDS